MSEEMTVVVCISVVMVAIWAIEAINKWRDE